MKFATISFVLTIGVFIALSIGPNIFLKDGETNSLLSSNSTLMKGMVPLISILFFIPGLTYGIVNKTIKSDKKLAQILYDSMASMMPYFLIFGLAWILLLVVFIVFNIPLGPGGGIFYP